MSDLDRLRRLGDQIVPPALDELRQTARRRTRLSAGVAIIGAAAVVTTIVGALQATVIEHNSAPPANPAPTTASVEEPIDLMQLAEGTPLEPGRYSTALFYGDGPTRVIVDLPEGYVGDGPIIGFDGGDIAFWGDVSLVDTDPCLGGRRVGAGTSVHDLAALLVAQQHVKTSQPVPVTIGGYHGVYVQTTVPENVGRCRGEIVNVLAAGKGHWLSSDVPSGTFNHWILNVDGQRVVGGARMLPDAAKRDEVIGIIESAEFTRPD